MKLAFQFNSKTFRDTQIILQFYLYENNTHELLTTKRSINSHVVLKLLRCSVTATVALSLFVVKLPVGHSIYYEFKTNGITI